MIGRCGRRARPLESDQITMDEGGLIQSKINTCRETQSRWVLNVLFKFGQRSCYQWVNLLRLSKCGRNVTVFDNRVISALLSGLAPEADCKVKEEMMSKGLEFIPRNYCSKCGICCAVLVLEVLLRIVVQNRKYCQWSCVENQRSESLFKIRNMLQSC